MKHDKIIRSFLNILYWILFLGHQESVLAAEIGIGENRYSQAGSEPLEGNCRNSKLYHLVIANFDVTERQHASKGQRAVVHSEHSAVRSACRGHQPETADHAYVLRAPGATLPISSQLASSHSGLLGTVRLQLHRRFQLEDRVQVARRHDQRRLQLHRR